MESNAIELIHKEYKDYYKNYVLVGSYKMFIPFYKVNMRMGYVYECELNIVEEYICKCISRGIENKNEILDILGLDEEIFNFTVSTLEKNYYIYIRDGKLFLSEESKKLFEIGVKHEEKSKNIEWFYDGLTPEYKIDFFGEEQSHIFLKYKEISQDENNLFVLPRTFPDYNIERDFPLLSKRALSVLNDNNTIGLFEKNIININDFELTSDREIYYHQYLMMVFKSSESQYKLLAFDPCGLSFVDQRITHNIHELYSKGELDGSFFQTQKSSYSDIHEIIGALKHYAKEASINIRDEERREAIEKLDSIDVENIVSRYIMNYEIREMFLHYLKNAEESLHIISPWMNNHVINDEFIRNIKSLLKKGVKISIIYGVSSMEELDKDIRNVKTHKLAEKLRKIGDEYAQGLFTITHGQTHEKLLICDRKYYINGSFNFLSYAGEDDQFFRNEGSTYSEDKTLIEETIRLRFKE